MTAKPQWVRVDRKNRCPVCSKDSWCCVLPQQSIVLCMRVESDRPSRCKMGGWIHRVNGEARKFEEKAREPEPPRIDAEAMMRSFEQGFKQRFAESLGVSVDSLCKVGAAWSPLHYAWAFPMVDGLGHTVGIRLRNESGRKWAVTGSRQGIFIPQVKPQDTVYLVEGPTDLAAALTLGLFAIGEPSCNACISYTQVAINRLRVKRAMVLADNDTVGIRGAKQLANELQVPCCTLLLPCKDLRQFLNLGGTAQLLQSLSEQLVWHQPQ